MQHERETYAVERHKLASQLEQAVKESRDFSSLLRQGFSLTVSIKLVRFFVQLPEISS